MCEDWTRILALGRMGPGTIAAFEAEMQAIAAVPDGLIASASDANAVKSRTTVALSILTYVIVYNEEES